MKLLNYNRRFLFLPTMLLAATFASAQTDSTKVKNATPHSDQRSENDSVTWNQSRRTGRRGLADRERARHAAQSADGDH